MGRRYILKKMWNLFYPEEQVKVSIFQMLLMKSSDIFMFLELLF